MTKLLIQIDDLVREMTDEEYAAYLVQTAVEPEPAPAPAPTKSTK
jgi:hypothetical protein